MKKSTKYIILVIICLLIKITIGLAMVNYWLDYELYHEPAVVCVSILFVLAVIFYILYWIHLKKELS